MFSYDQVQQLNRLEIEIYKYIMGHPVEVSTMTIRQLADHSHVSATTILRFLKRMGYDGYAEFKFMLKEQLRKDAEQPLSQTIVPMRVFFDRMNLPDVTTKIKQATKLIRDANMVVLVGSGTSAGLASYGTHLLADFGIYSMMLSNVFQPRPVRPHDLSGTVLLMLSVSGETDDVIQQGVYYQQNGAKLIAITASSHSTLAGIADTVLTYDTPEVRAISGSSIISQMPVVYYLEQLAMTVQPLA
ncbi:MurR/RpiR family transcriptional regulator [Lactiplantibacillus garii]|uniref:MurR/RpiR family transcriptional regulator n=1 Tax=Lactiplantibacillus garii TaxID=2306423 RepID=A0A3R8J6Z1_9LACO|nr:MurR/RpiR family transcriptional regulator [Lactiplantibacillus garii]RRK10394.1 MurR/RpiR family transcriptional regulator [Lactiplantibacillus garii]